MRGGIPPFLIHLHGVVLSYSTGTTLLLPLQCSHIATFINTLGRLMRKAQIDYILIDERRHLSVVDGQSFMGADCDTIIW
jgi:hypothetical protein